MARLVYGVGVNDADYVVIPTINGRRFSCYFYRKWVDMLNRCYCHKKRIKQPTYADCSVCKEWLTFSNFKAWMETQDWQGKELDKDLLIIGNKVYSPDTCVFVDQKTNRFITERQNDRGEFPLGVSFNKAGSNFRARCKNVFTGKHEHLGYFSCPNEAHKSWLARKRDLACHLADLQKDQRVADALRVRYSCSIVTG